MGKLEEYENMFIDDGDDYLTMARLCSGEWLKWVGKNPQFHRMTGFEQAHSKTAFRDGFFAGFEAKFFKQTDI